MIVVIIMISESFPWDPKKINGVWSIRRTRISLEIFNLLGELYRLLF